MIKIKNNSHLRKLNRIRCNRWRKKHPLMVKAQALRYANKRFFGGMKNTILIRDNFRCQICGLTEEKCGQEKERLCIHHGDGNKKNNSYWNLLTVCTACHRLIHLNFF